MMAKKPIAEEVDYEPTVNFYFPEDSKKAVAAPKNLKALGIDDDITVVVKGKVESIRRDSFGMTYSSIKIKLPNVKPKGVAEAMAEAQEKRQP